MQHVICFCFSSEKTPWQAEKLWQELSNGWGGWPWASGNWNFLWLCVFSCWFDGRRLFAFFVDASREPGPPLVAAVELTFCWVQLVFIKWGTRNPPPPEGGVLDISRYSTSSQQLLSCCCVVLIYFTATLKCNMYLTIIAEKRKSSSVAFSAVFCLHWPTGIAFCCSKLELEYWKPYSRSHWPL